jgi:hypothetical protein
VKDCENAYDLTQLPVENDPIYTHVYIVIWHVEILHQLTTEVFLGSKLPKFPMTGFYVTDVETHYINKKSTEKMHNTCFFTSKVCWYILCLMLESFWSKIW